MAVAHVIQITDLHLSAERAYNYVGWQACLEHINQARPDFVAVTGDLVLCDPDHVPDHAFVRSQLERIEAPWAALPGNHDLGDSGPAPYMGQFITAARRARWLGHFGTDRWTRDLGRWSLIGINAQLLGSGLEAEDEQNTWLEGVIAGARGRPVALFLHKPLFLEHAAEADAPVFAVSGAGRAPVLDILAGADLRLVACGHNHCYRTVQHGRTAIVWGPSTGQLVAEEAPYHGIHEPGLVHYRFEDDRVEFALVKPAGMVASDNTRLVEQHRAMRFTPRFTVEQALAG
ncbi:metallophosphoesterase family protein [Dongia sedimenti]|uniref:Metallophosphoesterase n=1 Tax=Dongia sedimenti TaxID=3064282 RepID=A0ABU0YJB0_9PROT|nr:metallophosphoesterase [Rhodospirillaceae bacterium R-7]